MPRENVPPRPAGRPPLCQSVASGVASAGGHAVLADVEKRARPTLFREGSWAAVYLRLRVPARRPPAEDVGRR